MKTTPHLAVSELTNTIYIVVGATKYDVTAQAINAVKMVEKEKK